MILEAVEPIARSYAMEILSKEAPLLSPNKLNISVDFFSNLAKGETNISNTMSPLEALGKSLKSENNIDLDKSVDFVGTTPLNEFKDKNDVTFCGSSDIEWLQKMVRTTSGLEQQHWLEKLKQATAHQGN